MQTPDPIASFQGKTFTYQLDASGHRGTAAIQRLVEYAPASGGLALWMQHRDIDSVPARVHFADTDNRRKQNTWVIGNDGSTLFYGPEFTRRPLEEQTGLVAHQVLHVALRHVDREQQMRQRLGDIDSELFAVCADAIVNASLSHLTWLSLPKGSVQLDTLLLHVLGIDQSVDISLHQWDTESLYRAIDDRQGSTGATSRQSSSRTSSDANAPEKSEKNAQESKNSTEQTQAPQSSNTPDQTQSTTGNQHADGPKARAARQLAATIIRDLIPNSSSSPEMRTEQSIAWQDRLLRAHAADAEQSFMRLLLADNSRVSTPWEHTLRTRLQRSLSLQTDINWSRPTRSWIANQGRTSSGKRLPWQPGTSYCRQAPRLCVMVDVSGSVNESLMNRFANEIDRILRLYRTEVLLIIGDDKVREQHRLKQGVSVMRSISFQGGGGTDFAPLINAGTSFKPDIGVFLTDLEGPAGNAPAWPIIWAVPADAVAQPVPFGQRIILD